MTYLIQNAVDAISLGALYGLMALGIALIFGVMGFVNFAHGEIVTAGAYALLFTATMHPGIAIIGTFGVAVMIALGMERVAFRPLRHAEATTLLITSFAVGFFLQNAARLTVGSLPKSVRLPSVVSESVAIGGVRISYLALADIAVGGALLISMWLLLTRTAIGIEMRAAAEDFAMAQLLGVRANRIIAMAFATSGVLAGAVALLLTAQLGIVTPTMGLAPALIGFVATVLGGLRSLVGAAIGGFLLGALTVALQALLPTDLVSFRDAFVFGSVIVILLLRPSGLFGSQAVGQVRV